MQQRIAQIYKWLAWLMLAGLLVQLYLAGAPMFGATSFQPHRMLGFTLITLAIAFPILALVGRLGREQMRLSILILVLSFVQAGLPWLRSSIPWIAALHAVNAAVLIGISIQIGRSGRGPILQAS